VLYKSFNSAQNHNIDTSLLEEISDKEIMTWVPFSKKKPFNTIGNCNNSSTPGLDKLSWRYLKKIVKNNKCTNKLIDIVNICINLGY